MILVDTRVGSKELLPYLQRISSVIPCRGDMLEYGDACFEGNGPEGSKIYIGVERKRISDMLNCIDDARYAAHQRPGMLSMYNKDILIVEGVWKPDTATGYLMECIKTLTWQPFNYRSRMVMYSKLFRYLLTVQMAGTMVIQSRDIEQTAYNILECYHYYQKKWENHTSLLETQRLAIPEMRGKPSLVRRWAADIDGIGVKHSLDAEKIFKTPFDLARSSETDWMRIPGVAYRTAKKVISQIHGCEE